MVLFIALFSLMNLTLNSKTATADLNNQAKVKPVQKVQPVTQEVTPQPEQPAEQAQPEPAPQPTPVAPSVYHSDDYYMEYIFQHESSGNPYAVNGIGCVGLGQACPASKLTSVCPDLGDVACQVQFFTNYAVGRYGSWAGAYEFWVANHWW